MSVKIKARSNKGPDLTGQRFGRWLVLYESNPKVGKDGHKDRVWCCRCDCGTIKDVLQRSLKAGVSLSCGCLQRETVHNSFIDLTGRSFGRLTVLYKVETSELGIIWHCKCICGKEVDVQSKHLLGGNTNSCGCLRLDRLREEFENNKSHNKFEIIDDYVVGYTNKNEKFYFSQSDYELISQYYWHINANGYVTTDINNKRIAMHKLLIECDNNHEIDHKNNIKHDNRRCNLRIVDRSMNNANRKKSIDSNAVYPGVYYLKNRKRNTWVAKITWHYQTHHLGTFYTEQDAINVRKKAEEKYFGKYSYSASQEDAARDGIIIESEE